MKNYLYLDIFNSKQELIEYLLKVQENTCYLCNERFTRGNKPTLDHVRPLSRGGDWSVDNLLLAHRKCNLEKGDRLLLEDGTLEPKKRSKHIKNRKLHRRIRNSICQYCWNGRLLDRNQRCTSCDSLAGPSKNPWYLRSASQSCDHSVFWCIACASGIINT